MPIQTLNFLDQKIQLETRDEADISVMREIFKLREYRRAQSVIESAKDPILDIGAHAGYFSIFCRAFNPKVKIIAMEPHPDNITAMERNFALNKIKGIKIVEAALSDHSGRGYLENSPDSHNHRLALTGNKNTIKVNLLRLSDLAMKENFSSISLIKMDIEGAEHDIVSALDDSEAGLIQNIILEYHRQDNLSEKTLEKLWREKGFGVEIFPSKFDKSMGFIFAHNKRI